MRRSGKGGGGVGVGVARRLAVAWARGVAVGVAVAVGLAVAPCEALAADAGAVGTTGGAAEVKSLEATIARDEETLATRDCVEACRALGSMRRAADKLCQIEPGPKCTDARARVKAAVDRVRKACPECAAATTEVDGPAPPPPQQPTIPRPAPGAEQAPVTASMPAESAPRRGGCAGCAVEERGGAGAAAPLAALGLALLLRRRRGR
jgi:uncharacterized protein (TIGR03382 family)